jgi:predicted nucleotidyltransferase
VLIGSHAAGTPDDESDVDVLYVLREGKRSRERRGEVELIPVALADFRKPPEWFKPATAHARVVQARVAELADAHGFRHVRDAWEGDIERAMEFRFE